MFDRIVAENLFSWGKLDYKIESGISLIDGFNYDDNTPEGSGKSSVPNILCWTLFGRIPKDAKIDEVIKYGEKYAVGLVDLSNGYKIIRSRKPNDLVIVDSEGRDFRGKDAKETQTMIQSLIGMSFETFCQVVYSPQNYSNKFITSNETEKAKILSEIQDLSIYDRARKKAHDLEKEHLVELRTLELQLGNLEDRKEDKEAFLTSLDNIIEGFYQKQKIELNRLVVEKTEILSNIKEVSVSEDSRKSIKEALQQSEEMYEALYKKHSELDRQIHESKSAKKQIERLNEQFSQNSKQATELEQDIEELKGSDGKCPTCGAAHEDETLRNSIRLKVNNLTRRLEDNITQRNEIVAEIGILKGLKDTSSLEGIKEEIYKELQEVKNLQKSLNQEMNELMQAENSIKTSKLTLQKLESEIDRIGLAKPDKELATVESLKKEISALKTQIKEITLKCKDFTEKGNKYGILKDEFKQLKSFLFSSLLEEISYKSTELASNLFEVPINIKFFNESEDGEVSKIQTQIVLDGIERSLGLLSGGQFRRVQLSVDLALSKIVAERAGTPCNFRVLDETFKDLSSNSMEKMIRLLEGLDGSTIVIEHNPLIKPIINNTFFVEYRNGESRNAV